VKVYLESNGCIKRHSEIVKLKTYFNLNHAQIVDSPKNADYLILSTCALKEEDENYSVSRIKYLKKFHGKLLVLGCFPDIAPTKFSEFVGTTSITPREIDKIDAVFTGNAIKYANLEDSNIIPKQMTVSTTAAALQKLRDNFELSSTFKSRVTKYLKKKIKVIMRMGTENFYLNISRGCLGSCSYCAIRKAIGKLVSRPVDSIVDQFRGGLQKGYKDFVILGDDVGAYGADNGQTFPKLISQLINELEMMQENSPESNGRFKDVKFLIQEIHPHWFVKYKQEIIELIKTKSIKSVLCPIESGNDRILGLMNRRYSVEEISTAFHEARTIYPEIQFSTHVMVGFPSETEEEFRDSLRAVEKIHFDEVTVFAYNKKEGTPASKMTPEVDERTIKRRVNEARKYLEGKGIKTYFVCPN
jgi:threonylcarbamoyladenosine tRNA methylthiotransferase CDKAL1